MAITTRSNNVDNKQPGVCLAKGLARAPETTGQGRDAEKQQCRTDNRPGDLRLDDANLRLPQDKEREHQLRDIAETDIEQSADGAAGAVRKLFGGTPDPVGEHGNGDGTGQEDPAGRRIEDVA